MDLRMLSLTSPQPKTGTSGTSSVLRPRGISILSVLDILGGLYGVALGIYNAVNGDPNLSYFNVGNGLIGVINGWGLWKGKGWAWNLFLIKLVVGLVSTPFGLTRLQLSGITPSIASEVVAITFAYYVTRKPVMAFFGKTSIREEFF